jgi:hypothetical protein
MQNLHLIVLKYHGKNTALFNFATMGQWYKSFYYHSMVFTAVKLLTHNKSNTMEWQYITMVKSFITLALGATMGHRYVLQLLFSEKSQNDQQLNNYQRQRKIYDLNF